MVSINFKPYKYLHKRYFKNILKYSFKKSYYFLKKFFIMNKKINQIYIYLKKKKKKGPIYAAKYFIPLLKETQGRFVVVSSLAALIAAPTRALYAASKHALMVNIFNMFVYERYNN